MFHPSGGLGYFIRGLRHSWVLWEPFRRWVMTRMKEDVFPSCENRGLLLVGHSYGFCFDFSQFPKNTTLYGVDPDLFSRLVLRLRAFRNGLSYRPVSHSVALTLLSEKVGAVVFCNVLGQQSRGAVSIEKYLSQIQSQFSGTLVSFHDVYSVEGARFEGDHGIVTSRNLTIPKLVDDSGLDLKAGRIDIYEHPTVPMTSLKVGKCFSYSEWRLTERSSHWVEWWRG